MGKKITLVNRWVKIKEYPNPVFIKIYLKEFDSYGILYNRFKIFRFFGKTITLTNPFSIACDVIYRSVIDDQAMEGENNSRLITDISKSKILQIS
jgi:hypothetical protein